MPRPPHTAQSLSFRLMLRPLEDRITPSHYDGHEDDYYDDYDDGDDFYDDYVYYEGEYYYDDFDDLFYDDSDDLWDTFLDFDPFEEFGSPLEWDDTEYADIDPTLWIPIGTDIGGPPEAVIVAPDGDAQLRVQPYDPSFLGGVRVAQGDVNGDGVPDLMTVPGPGMPALVKVFDGVSGSPIHSFLAFEETFTGGAFVVAADVNRDGISEIILSPDEGGGPRVRVLNGNTLVPLQDFFGIDDPEFRGGCRVAVGDLDGDFASDLIVAAGFGGGPRVAVFDGDDLLGFQPDKLLPDFFAFEDTLRNGAYPAIGDLNDDGFSDLVFGGGPGGAPRVQVLDGASARENVFLPIGNFFAGDPNSRDGAQVGIGSSRTGSNSILAAPRGEPTGLFTPNGQSLGSYNPYPQSSSGTTVGSTVASTGTSVSSSTSSTTNRRPADDAAFNHGTVIGKIRGNYVSEYFTTIIDERAPSGQREKRVRVEVQLSITTVTPESPNNDPAVSNGDNYRWSGSIMIRPAGYRSITVQVYGNYTCTQFPTVFKQQLGSMSMYTQGNAAYRSRPTAGWTGTDTNVAGRITTNVFDFDNPGTYFSSPHSITLTKVN